MNNTKQLRKAMIIVGCVGFVASSFLSATGFMLASQYNAEVEFRQLSKPGIHLFPLIAVRYTVLAVTFLLYVVCNWLKNNSKWKFVISFPLIFLTIFFAVLIIFNADPLPNLGSEYAIMTIMLDKGSVYILILSTILLGLNGIAFFRLIQKKNFP